MRRALPDITTVLWVVLSLATVVSWQLGMESQAHAWAGATVLAIGFVKLRLVGIHFMEIGTAPIALRAIFESYVVVVFAALLAIFLFA